MGLEHLPQSNRRFSCKIDSRTYRMNLPYITELIVNEILTWVPAQDLVRFKSVCKQWKSLIDEPSFITLQKVRAPQSIIGTSRYPDFLPLHLNEIGTFLSARTHGRVLGSSSDGIVCVTTPEKRYQVIINPATGQSLQLPQLKSGSYPMEMRVYPNPQRKEVNVVAICKYRHMLPCRTYYWAVFTVGVDSKWRCDEFPVGAVHCGTVIRWSAVLCENAPICLIKYSDDTGKRLGTLRIDPRTAEATLQRVPFRWMDDWDFSTLEAHEWDGKFSFSRVENMVIHTWVLDDEKKNGWSYKTVIAPNEEEISICLVQQQTMWYTSCRNGNLFSLDLVTEEVYEFTCNNGRIYGFKGGLGTIQNLVSTEEGGATGMTSRRRRCRRGCSPKYQCSG